MISMTEMDMFKKHTRFGQCFESEAPEGVRGINNLAVVFVKGKKMDNITMFNENSYNEGMGTNFDGENLYIYRGLSDITISYNDAYRLIRSMAYQISSVSWWFNRNSGKSISGYSYEDVQLDKLLVNGGLNIE